MLHELSRKQTLRVLDAIADRLKSLDYQIVINKSIYDVAERSELLIIEDTIKSVYLKN